MIEFTKIIKKDGLIKKENVKNVWIKIGDITIFNSRSKGKIGMVYEKDSKFERGIFSYKKFEKMILEYFNKEF